MSNKKPDDEFSLETFKAMDIVRGMTQEEIKELLLSNPLYKFLVDNENKQVKDDEKE
tara:strand:+ start:1383 stop:1553 length:171 start_codon:yes stop_codon:yes gene_type:complete